MKFRNKYKKESFSEAKLILLPENRKHISTLLISPSSDKLGNFKVTIMFKKEIEFKNGIFRELTLKEQNDRHYIQDKIIFDLKEKEEKSYIILEYLVQLI